MKIKNYCRYPLTEPNIFKSENFMLLRQSDNFERLKLLMISSIAVLRAKLHETAEIVEKSKFCDFVTCKLLILLNAKLLKSPFLDFFESLAIYRIFENPKIEMISEDYRHKVR